MDSPYSQELAVAIDALRHAARLGETIMKADKGVIEKKDYTLVTLADFSIQALLTATFHHAFPTDTFVGEETADDLRENPDLLDRVWGLLQNVAKNVPQGSHCKVPESRDAVCELIELGGRGEPGTGRCWVFDPVDGTKNYVQGKLYAINIGLLDHGRQVFAAVACPNMSMDIQAPVYDDSLDETGTGCIAFAARDHGSYVMRLFSDDTPAQARKLPRVSESAPPGGMRLVSGDAQSESTSGAIAVQEKALSRLPRAPAAQDSFLLPWVLNWVVMALGIADVAVWIYKNPKRSAKLVDHAGAVLIYEEAGGKITDALGVELDFGAGRDMKANRGFAAGPRAEHTTIVKAVGAAVEELGAAELLAPIARAADT